MAKNKRVRTQKQSRFWTKFFTYAFLIFMSVVIIYPLLITATSAFKAGNLLAFDLSFEAEFTLDNFRRLFDETLYGTWYMNTLFVAIVAMLIQVTIITLAGFAYSRYRFIGRKVINARKYCKHKCRKEQNYRGPMDELTYKGNHIYIG